MSMNHAGRLQGRSTAFLEALSKYHPASESRALPHHAQRFQTPKEQNRTRGGARRYSTFISPCQKREGRRVSRRTAQGGGGGMDYRTPLCFQAPARIAVWGTFWPN